MTLLIVLTSICLYFLIGYISGIAFMAMNLNFDNSTDYVWLIFGLLFWPFTWLVLGVIAYGKWIQSLLPLGSRIKRKIMPTKITATLVKKLNPSFNGRVK